MIASTTKKDILTPNNARNHFSSKFYFT